MKAKKSFIASQSLKILSSLTVIILLIVALSSCAARKKAVTVQTVGKEKTMSHDQEEPYVVVEEMPLFPGGDSTLLAYISHNTKYPETAKINKIQGKVIVRFCVTSVGSVNRISVLKSVNPDLDAEAARVVGSLPSFKPGKQGGKPVPVWYMVPIEFSLK
jgi:periplasmic protein TonB